MRQHVLIVGVGLDRSERDTGGRTGNLHSGRRTRRMAVWATPWMLPSVQYDGMHAQLPHDVTAYTSRYRYV